MLGVSGSVLVYKLVLRTFTSEFESQWVSHSLDLVPPLSKKLSKLQLGAPGVKVDGINLLLALTPAGIVQQMQT